MTLSPSAETAGATQKASNNQVADGKKTRPRAGQARRFATIV
jgi:hypothetical protein